MCIHFFSSWHRSVCAQLSYMIITPRKILNHVDQLTTAVIFISLEPIIKLSKNRENTSEYSVLKKLVSYTIWRNVLMKLTLRRILWNKKFMKSCDVMNYQYLSMHFFCKPMPICKFLLDPFLIQAKGDLGIWRKIIDLRVVKPLAS